MPTVKTRGGKLLKSHTHFVGLYRRCLQTLIHKLLVDIFDLPYTLYTQVQVFKCVCEILTVRYACVWSTILGTICVRAVQCEVQCTYSF